MSRHILVASDFDREDLLRIFNTAYGMEEKIDGNAHHELLKRRKGVGLLFFEESYRTHNSFQNAVLSMGGRILFDIQKEGIFSSFKGATSKKGESLASVVENHCYSTIGAIVLRHPQVDSARIAAEIAGRYNISIINGGNGPDEHPTQAWLDEYTIWKERDHKLDNVRLVVCNDLEKSRTIHSLSLSLASNFIIPQLGICAPNGSELPDILLAKLSAAGTEIIRFNSIHEAAEWAEFIYMTRPQKERFPNKRDLFKFQGFQINADTMAYLLKRNIKVMHPQPIDSVTFNEITPDAQDCRKFPNCIIMKQSHNGLPIRMALLRMLLIDRED